MCKRVIVEDKIFHSEGQFQNVTSLPPTSINLQTLVCGGQYHYSPYDFLGEIWSADMTKDMVSCENLTMSSWNWNTGVEGG